MNTTTVQGVEFLNMTPYTILVETGGVEIVFPPSGQTMIIDFREEKVEKVGPFKCRILSIRQVLGVCGLKENFFYIVDLPTLLALEDSGLNCAVDIIAPDMQKAIKENANVMRVSGFIRLTENIDEEGLPIPVTALAEG
ncbi:TPA_asm: hypothetical protein vir519_00008 [Caudoviricetes sp. vir519]|nr:TPA_asm: hypothetical protein vir519_00008 [Caudoviricetes sp. vir519]